MSEVKKYKPRQSFGLKLYLATARGDSPEKGALTIGTENSQIVFTAIKAGLGGNGISITLVNPAENAPLSVEVEGKDITVNLAYETDAVTSTVNDVIEAILSSDEAGVLVTAGPGTGNGTGVLAAAAKANLTGGTNGTSVYGKISGILDVDIPGLGRTSDDTTSHDSPEGFAEYLKSAIKDGRSISIPINYDPADTMHQRLKLEEASDESSRFRFVFPVKGEDFESEALVLNFSNSNPVRGVKTATLETQLTGAPLPVDLG